MIRTWIPTIVPIRSNSLIFDHLFWIYVSQSTRWRKPTYRGMSFHDLSSMITEIKSTIPRAQLIQSTLYKTDLSHRSTTKQHIDLIYSQPHITYVRYRA